jgi:hypothetical protein
MISYEVLGATFWPCSGLRGEDRPASRGNTAMIGLLDVLRNS